MHHGVIYAQSSMHEHLMRSNIHVPIARARGLLKNLRPLNDARGREGLSMGAPGVSLKHLLAVGQAVA